MRWHGHVTNYVTTCQARERRRTMCVAARLSTWLRSTTRAIHGPYSLSPIVGKPLGGVTYSSLRTLRRSLSLQSQAYEGHYHISCIFVFQLENLSRLLEYEQTPRFLLVCSITALYQCSSLSQTPATKYAVQYWNSDQSVPSSTRSGRDYGSAVIPPYAHRDGDHGKENVHRAMSQPYNPQHSQLQHYSLRIE